MQENVAVSPEELSPQQELQQLVLAVCLAPQGTGAVAGMDVDDESSDPPLLQLAQRTWVLVNGKDLSEEQASSASRFGSHLGLALVALGVVPVDSGVASDIL